MNLKGKALYYTHLVFLLVILNLVLTVEILHWLPGVLRLILISWNMDLIKLKTPIP